MSSGEPGPASSLVKRNFPLLSSSEFAGSTKVGSASFSFLAEAEGVSDSDPVDSGEEDSAVEDCTSNDCSACGASSSEHAAIESVVIAATPRASNFFEVVMCILLETCLSQTFSLGNHTAEQTAGTQPDSSSEPEPKPSLYAASPGFWVCSAHESSCCLVGLLRTMW